MNLTKSDRERITTWVEQNAFADERESLAKDQADFAERYRVSWNGGPKLCAVIDKLPDGVVNTRFSSYRRTHQAFGCSCGRVAWLAQDGHDDDAFDAEGVALITRANDIRNRAKALAETEADQCLCGEWGYA